MCFLSPTAFLVCGSILHIKFFRIANIPEFNRQTWILRYTLSYFIFLELFGFMYNIIYSN
jgi:hypothetical protein